MIATALLLFTPCACAYYRLELRRSKLEPADVIIVPGLRLTGEGHGSVALWNRMRMAKLLMDRGYASRLIVTGGHPRSGITESAKMVEYGTVLGIPEAVMIQEPRAKTSVENGLFSAELMVERGYRSALVVSGSWHLCYALPVFRDAFVAHGLELYWAPVRRYQLDGLSTPEPPDLVPRPGDRP